MTKRGAKADQLKFEDAVDQLEQLIERIETGEIGLEESLKQYQRGTALINRCRAILSAAEKQIAELTVNEEGGLQGEVKEEDEQ